MIALDLGLITLAVAFLIALVRVAIGPSLADRAVAADVGLFGAMAGIALLAVRFEAFEFADAVLIATLLGFVATTALAWLLGKGE